MTPEALGKLIAGGEAPDVEFKGEGVRAIPGEPAADVRRRGCEAVHLEGMVVEWVQKHGRITRREIAQLCRPRSMQAIVCLKLEKSGNIKRIAGWKGTKYGLPNK